MNAENPQALRPAVGANEDGEEPLAAILLDGESPVARPEERLRTVRSLGVGPFGETHLTFDERMRRHVARKVLACEGPRREVADGFERGARVAARLTTARVAMTLEIVRRASTLEIMRSFVEGENLLGAVEAGTFASQADLYRCFGRVAEGLDELHRRGVVHGNLKCENALVASSGEPVFVDFVVHENASWAADLACLARALRIAAFRRKEVVGEPFFPGEGEALEATCGRAERSGTTQGFASAGEFASSIRVRLLNEKDVASSRETARRVRGVALMTGGLFLVMISLFFAAVNLVGGLSVYGIGFFGLILQNIVMMSATAFLPGAYLTIAGLRGMGVLSLSSSSQNPSRLGVDPSSSVDGQPANRGHASKPRRASPLTVSRRDEATVWSRPLGSLAGSLLCAATVAIGAIGAADLTIDRRPLEIPFSVVALTSISVAAFVGVAFYGARRFGVRPIPLDVKALGLGRLSAFDRLRLIAARWWGSERLTLSGETLLYEIRGPLGVAGRSLPRSTVWDVAYGGDESGVEIAATGKPLRFGRGLSQQDRVWLVDDIKRALDSMPADSPQPALIEPARQRFDQTAFASFAFGAAAPFGLVELVAGFLGEGGDFPLGSVLGFIEGATAIAVGTVVIVGNGLVMLGAWRLANGLAGGRASFLFGYYLRVAMIALLWAFVAAVFAYDGDIEVPSAISLPMNLSHFAYSMQVILGGVAVLWLYARRDDPGLA